MHVRVEAARDVKGDVAAAQRKSVGMDEAAVREYRERGGAGAHVDDGGAEIGLVVGERREARHVGTGDQGFDEEMAALDREHQVAGRRHVGGDDMHVDAETRRQHAARIAHAAGVVEGVADRQRMQHDAALAGRLPAAGSQHAGNVLVGDVRALEGDFARVSSSLAIRPADIERMTDSTWHLALRSARSTA